VRLLRTAAIVTFGLSGWVAGAALAASPAYACTIPTTGGSCSPDHLPPVSGSIVASKSGTLMLAGSFSATYTENVYSDPSNPYCSGCLIWVVQVTNSPNSVDAITRVTIARFGSFLADVGDTPSATPSTGFSPAAGSDVPATTVDRSSSGVIGWNFPATGGLGAIIPGRKSVLLEARTNAPAATPGTISAIDAGTDTQPAFQPVLPEAWVPALGLVGGAVLGGVAFRRRRRAARRTPNAPQ
jgi:hypothetical protein